MERDPDNHYQHSAGFIRRKIKQLLTNPFTGEAYDQAMESIENDLNDLDSDDLQDKKEEPKNETEKPEDIPKVEPKSETKVNHLLKKKKTGKAKLGKSN